MQNSVNGSVPQIPYPWLVFNEKVKVNSVFLRDSTGISDSVLLLFGGNVSRGGLVSSLSPVQFFISKIICCGLYLLGDYFSILISSMHDEDMTFFFFFLIGWASENVGRVLGILHETCAS